MSIGFPLISLILGVIVVIGLGFLIVWLCRQVAGAKDNMGDAKDRQRQMEEDLNSPDEQ